MAAVNFSPSGFSYAQAARGVTSVTTSQTPSSKVTSGTASPSNGTFSELTSSSNWADDVEESVAEKTVVSQKAQQEESKSSQPKDGAVERAKAEDKTQGAVSNVSSPDLEASSSTTTKDDDTSSGPNGTSSESTWETKSQTSEPAWIAERKERQSNSQANEKTPKGEKKAKEAPTPNPPKPVMLQDAPPPPVNPWLKRAEEAKAKMAATPKPPVTSRTSESSTLKENQPPRPETRRKANSVASIPRESLSNLGEEVKKSSSSQGKRADGALSSNPRHHSKQSKDDIRSDAPQASSAKGAPIERQSQSASSQPPPSVRDDVSWPTPENAQDKERKDLPHKENDEKRDDEDTPAKRKKTEWVTVAVPTTYSYETDVNTIKGSKPRGTQSGDRATRGGNGNRGRGGHRGASGGMNGAERQTSRSNSAPDNQDSNASATQRATSTTVEAESMPPPAKPTRASSAGPRHEQKNEPLQERSSLARSVAGPTPPERNGQNGTNASSYSNASFTKSNEGRRTKSPKKMDAAAELKEEEPMPTPIPRRSSVGTQTDEAAQTAESSTRDGPQIRMVHSESRKESRNADNNRDPTWAPPRNSKRGGRGRGGNGARELANGHPGANAYGNNYAADFGTAAYGVPPSPGYQAQRGHHQFSYPQPNRGGYRGNLRSQSIPFENFYGQQPYRGAFQGAQAPVPAMQTYVPGMYDANGYPMSAVPYTPQIDTSYLINMVTTQLEYYFSIDNLLKDMFLRQHMDSQGFVFLDIVAGFNRIKQLTQDKELLKAVCIGSEIIEIRVGEDGKERLRKREGWGQFLLPLDQRDQSVQNNGPDKLERLERPQLQVNGFPPPYRGPASAGLPSMQQRFDRRSYDSSYPMVNGYPAQFSPYGEYSGTPETLHAETMNGEEMRGRAAKSPIHDNLRSPNDQPRAASMDSADNEPDAFPDDQVTVLTVVVRTSEQRLPFHSAASRTFSNGSIDSRSVFSETSKSTDAKSQPSTNGETAINGIDSKLSLSRTVSPRQVSPKKVPSRERTPANADFNVFWVKDQDYPVEQLPSDLTSEPYMQLRHKALDQRNQAATGTCPYDLDVLYQFWCHFLLRNFNNSMYTEFKFYAGEDAKERHNITGLHNLVQFYSKSLSSHHPIRDRVVKDYVELVRNEPSKLEGAAFKQLRSAWRNGALNLKNRKKLADILDDKLKEQLDKVES